MMLASESIEFGEAKNNLEQHLKPRQREEHATDRFLRRIGRLEIQAQGRVAAK